MAQSSSFNLQILKFLQLKKRFYRLFLNPPRSTGSLNPKKVNRSLNPEIWTVVDTTLLTIQESPTADTHLIFLPGGAYLLEATLFHRKFAEKIAKTAGLWVTMVDYPKSPEHTFKTTHDLIWKVYHQLVQKYPDHKICLLGDSAGGGLALAFLQTLRDRNITPLPLKSVLISPWLDLSLSHPQIPDYTARDPILTLAGLEYAAEMYAGGEDLRNPLLSPLHGDLNDLGEILLIAGSEEIFYPDCKELLKKVKETRGTQIAWEMGENLIHAWPIFPFPESKQAVERIADFLVQR